MLQRKMYYGFDDWQDLRKKFEIDTNVAEPEFVYAIYNQPAYEGHAEIVFFQHGKWLHVQASHCSCHGLEGQWKPDEFNALDHLRARQVGKTILSMSDVEGEFPEATQDQFDRWLLFVRPVAETLAA